MKVCLSQPLQVPSSGVQFSGNRVLELHILMLAKRG